MKPSGIIAIILTLGLLAGIFWVTSSAKQVASELEAAVQDEVRTSVALVEGFITNQGLSLAEAVVESQALVPADVRIVLWGDRSGYVVHVARPLNPDIILDEGANLDMLYNFGYDSRTGEYSEKTWTELTRSG